MLIDRYLFRLVAARFAAVVAVVIAILALANVRNLTSDLTQTNAAGRLLVQLSVLLMPEHLALAIPLATFLGVALTVRALILRGEWPILAAAGLRPSRILAAPMALALIATGVLLADRLSWRPAGERGLDALYAGIAAGVYGTPLSVGEPVPFDPQTTLLAGRVTRLGSPLELADVVIHKREDDWTAPRATVTSDRDGEVVLELHDGEAVHRPPGDAPRSVRFGRLRLRGHPPALGLVAGNWRQRLDRLGGGTLLAVAQLPGDYGRHAMAALVARIEGGLFLLLLPLLGMGLGQPRARRADGWGLLAGIVLIVGHVQAAAFVEDHLWRAPVAAGVAHWCLWAALVLAARRWLIPRWSGRPA